MRSVLTLLKRRTFIARALVMGGISLVLGSSVSVFTTVGPAQADITAASVGEATPSAVTVRWADVHNTTADRNDANYSRFRNIVVSVSQTEGLSHQGISVSWSGAVPTSADKFATDYFQAMQCWGEAVTPEQCQFGAPAGNLSDLTGYQAQTRVIETTLDPAQSARMPSNWCVDAPDCTIHAVPYQTPQGASTFSTGELFSSATSNEISAVATAADGTGMFNFEVQTGLDAPHLGCGQSDSRGEPRACTLVIVPRGRLDPNGRTPSDTAGRVSGSPLTYSAWKNRIEIPLHFAPIGQSCSLGKSEVRIVGSDIASKAMSSWQSGLCSSGQTFGYTRISDDESRAQIASGELGSSHMAIVSGPLASTNEHAAGIEYAPLAQSAVVIAYNIDYSLYRNSPLYQQLDGTKVHTLKLNQRLVAKLLTQSYRVDTPGTGAHTSAIADNPRSLTVDPEFLSLNPDFSDFTRVEPQGLMVPFGNSDAYAHVWEWIRANADAKAFLEGTPDDWGMVVNPNYESLGLTTGDAPVSFPKADLTTHSDVDDVPPYGTLELRPYYNSFDETGLRTLRADANVRTSWDPFKLPAPGAYVPNGPQPAGQRFALSITDLATAYRYGLDVAALQGTVEGNFVEPTPATLSKSIASRVSAGIPGVTTTSWTKSVANSYPLTEVAYAAVNLCSATADERKSYSSLVTYVAGPGQVQTYENGGLPYGYVALTSASKAVAKKAASTIANPGDLTSRCPEMTPAVEPPVISTGGISTGGMQSTGKKMYIPKPMYGSGETTDFSPIISKTLTAGGYLLGIPMVIAGWIIERRVRRGGMPATARVHRIDIGQ